MIYKLNETHDPKARSWVPSANVPGTPFPIQNLPFGVYRTQNTQPRIGVAIGDFVLDLFELAGNTLLEPISQETKAACRARVLNDLMALTPKHWSELRLHVFRLLHESAPAAKQQTAEPLLVSQASAVMELPCRIGDYTDFYAGIYHATNVGRLFRPQNPLLPNYKWIPIAYHGRASSIVISGIDIVRPRGQVKSPDSDVPTFGQSQCLDYELELGFYIGSGNQRGRPISIEHAEKHIFGACLLNDWSARDIQTWEYQPLGPFLAKSFATTVSPWIVTMEALAPFRCAAFKRSAEDPLPLPYLHSADNQENGGIDISLEIALSTNKMRADNIASFTVSRVSSRDLYWTVGQCVAHHTSNGCNLQPGNLLGSGTISGRAQDTVGSLLELTRQGAAPLTLPHGEQRVYLQDGDEVIMSGWCRSKKYMPIGFGDCRGRITDSAHPTATI